MEPTELEGKENLLVPEVVAVEPEVLVGIYMFKRQAFNHQDLSEVAEVALEETMDLPEELLVEKLVIKLLMGKQETLELIY